MIECEELTDNKECNIVYELTGKKYKPDPKACFDCCLQENPKDLNTVTAGLSFVVCKRNKLKVPKEVYRGLTTSEPLFLVGPGTELQKIIPGFFDTKGCDCKSYSKKMNRWGVKGCREKFTEIVDYLVTKSKNNSYTKYFGEAPARVVATKWVKKAIDRAEASFLLEEESWTSKKWPFVWTYYGKEEIDKELYYSINLVKKWHPDSRCIVIGDKPDWYDGEFIHKPRIQRTPHQAFKDCYSKLLKAAEGLDQFIWMMDDVYWLKPFTIKEAATPKYVRHVTQERIYNWRPKNKWGRTRKESYKWLLENDYPTYDFASHMPQPIISKSFILNEEELGLMENYKNWENIYFNRFLSGKSEDWGKKSTRINKKIESLQVRHKILNHTHNFFHTVEPFLEEILSNGLQENKSSNTLETL